MRLHLALTLPGSVKAGFGHLCESAKLTLREAKRKVPTDIWKRRHFMDESNGNVARFMVMNET